MKDCQDSDSLAQNSWMLQRRPSNPSECRAHFQDIGLDAVNNLLTIQVKSADLLFSSY